MTHNPHSGSCQGACCLKIQDLSVTFGTDAVLEHVNLHMHCGQIVALIGPNGAGKSTLIRAILGEKPYTGTITFSPAGGAPEKLRIGYVPQSPGFDPGDPISVLDLFACCLSRRPAFLPVGKAFRQRVLSCLAAFTAKPSSISAWAPSPAARCSGCCWHWRWSPCPICSSWTSPSPA